jgi:hypothetical protein
MGAFKRDVAGIGRILRSADAAAMVRGAAERVAADAEASSGLPVEVEEYTTDRAAAAVVITHPAGLAEQAKHGTLTRAAAAIGLEVRAR